MRLLFTEVKNSKGHYFNIKNPLRYSTRTVRETYFVYALQAVHFFQVLVVTRSTLVIRCSTFKNINIYIYIYIYIYFSEMIKYFIGVYFEFSRAFGSFCALSSFSRWRMSMLTVSWYWGTLN